MGRPRKIRPEDFTVTASPENEGGIMTQTNGDGQATVVEQKNILLPYLGKDSLEIGTPRYFVNGRKLLRMRKIVRTMDKEGKPIYTTKRDFAGTVDRSKPRGKKLYDLLVKANIPGV